MMPERWSIVDIETTGGSFSYDRIIEIAVIVMEKGNIIRTYQTLVNPERYVPESILQLTGIKEADIVKAPTFADIAEELYELLKDTLFIAHNARFDKGFIKAEFARLNKSFNPKTLCTVQLSRKVFPYKRYHNLDELIQRLGIYCENRHRALDDASVLYEFFCYIEKNFSEDEKYQYFAQALKEIAIPPHIPTEKLEELPELPGVYIFYDNQGFPLYIGKSINIRERVHSHFYDSARSNKEMKIFQHVHNIETITTAGELGALLLESELIKTMQPLHNRKLRRTRILTAIKHEIKNNYKHAQIVSLTRIDPGEMHTIAGIFRSRRQAEQYLTEVAKEFSLCKKLLGIEKADTYCFNYYLQRCKGGCAGEETFQEYNERFTEAFKKTALRPWPYKGIIALEEKKEPSTTEGEVFFIDEWCLIAKGKYSEFGFDVEKIPEKVFDYDQYKILNRHLSKRKHARLRRIISREEFEKLLYVS